MKSQRARDFDPELRNRAAEGEPPPGIARISARTAPGVERRPSAVEEVNPFRCRLWALHDRLSEYVTPDSCHEELESVRRHGQLVPVLGRPLCGDPDHDVEVIYGARRLFVAQQLNVPLRVELRKLSDKDALIAMDIENRHRTDISPYERGLSYARWLRRGHFSSQEEIASALHISASQVSRLLKMAELPAVLVSAFSTPMEIREAWALELLQLCRNPEFRPLLLQRARALAARESRIHPQEVYRRLTAPAASPVKAIRSGREDVVRSTNGRPLFRVRRNVSSVALIIPTGLLSSVCFTSLCDRLRDVLDQPTTSS
jgi:ParB family chromosome partitioning protein